MTMKWYRRAMALVMFLCLVLAVPALAEEPVAADEPAIPVEELETQSKASASAKKVTITEGSKAKVNLGSTLQLHAEISPEAAEGTALKWTSSSKKIATVDENGLVTPVKAGSVTIKVTTKNKKTDSIKITVVDPTVATKVVLSESGTVELALGSELVLDATLEPATAETALKWSSSSTKIAKVKDGVVTPVKEGTATITVKTRNGKSDTVKVKVVDPYKPTKVELDASGTVTLNMGDTLTLNAALKPATAKSELKWSSSSTKIAKVKDGVVTPVKEGTATITVKTRNGKSDSVKVKVVDPYKPTKVELDKSGTVNLEIGKTLTLNATLKPASAKSELKWTTSSKKIATVKGGVVTPVGKGTATITVKTANGKSDSVKVKVVAAEAPTPKLKELKPAITSAKVDYDNRGSWLEWSNNHPVVKAISGMKVDHPYSRCDHELEELFTGDYASICGKTSHAELHNFRTGWTVILKEGAPYSIYGFYPGMTLSEAKKNDSQRSDVKIGKTYDTDTGLKRVNMIPKEKLGYLDTDIFLYYEAGTDIIKYVEFVYFIGA